MQRVRSFRHHRAPLLTRRRVVAAGLCATLLTPPAAFGAVMPADDTMHAPSYLTAWGSNGTGPGAFDEPVGVALGLDGSVIVADQGNDRIQVFDRDGAFLRQWGESGVAAGELLGANGVAVDSDGDVYVADTLNNRVQEFNASGAFVGQWGSRGRAEGQFNAPYALAIDGAGQVYVADSNNHRIQVFTERGDFVRQWGASGAGNGEFAFPQGVAIDGHGRVYVADTFNHRVQVFTERGDYLGQWGGEGAVDGQFESPRGVAVGGDQLYVTDTGNTRVQVFTTDGTYLTQWGTNGAGCGQFRFPTGIAVDDTGRTYVSDTWNHRIEAFAPGPRPDGRIRRRPDRPLKGDGAYNATAVGQTAGGVVEAGATSTYVVSAQNDGPVADTIRLRGTASSQSFRVRYSSDGEDVTAAVAAGTLTGPELAPGESMALTVTVTPRPGRQGPDVLAARVVTTSTADPTRADTVGFVTRRRRATP